MLQGGSLTSRKWVVESLMGPLWEESTDVLGTEGSHKKDANVGKEQRGEPGAVLSFSGF